MSNTNQRAKILSVESELSCNRIYQCLNLISLIHNSFTSERKQFLRRFRNAVRKFMKSIPICTVFSMLKVENRHPTVGVIVHGMNTLEKQSINIGILKFKAQLPKSDFLFASKILEFKSINVRLSTHFFELNAVIPGQPFSNHFALCGSP